MDKQGFSCKDLGAQLRQYKEKIHNLRSVWLPLGNWPCKMTVEIKMASCQISDVLVCTYVLEEAVLM